MGTTAIVNNAEYRPLNSLQDGNDDGYFLDSKCFGSYIHGILDNQEVIDFILKPYAGKLTQKPFDYKSFNEEQYNKLADHVRNHVNMDLVYNIMEDK
jgi:adenosylcobyric acid synthase